MTWRHQKYGTRADPIRQSDLNDIASQYGCSRRFQLRKQAEAAGEAPTYDTADSRRCLGTAVHQVIHLYLTHHHDRILQRGEVPSADSVRPLVARETVVAAEGLPIRWEKTTPAKAADEGVAMVRGFLASARERIHSVVLSEAPFLVEIDCGDGNGSRADRYRYWLTGTIDLAYRPRHAPEQLGLVDFKGGSKRLPQIILDHSYQLGIYSYALAQGTFRPGEDDERVEQFPTELWICHLRDFIPYAKASRKKLTRPEEAAWYGVERGTTVKTSAGELRGPGWYRSARRETDLPRLRHSLRAIVGSVRRGTFYEALDEHCARCPFRGPCLTEGHAARGAERDEVEAALRGVDLGDLTDFAA